MQEIQSLKNSSCPQSANNSQNNNDRSDRVQKREENQQKSEQRHLGHQKQCNKQVQQNGKGDKVIGDKGLLYAKNANGNSKTNSQQFNRKIDNQNYNIKQQSKKQQDQKQMINKQQIITGTNTQPQKQHQQHKYTQKQKQNEQKNQTIKHIPPINKPQLQKQPKMVQPMPHQNPSAASISAQGMRVFRSGQLITNPKKNITYRAQQLIGTGTFGQVLSVTSSQFPSRALALKILKSKPAYISQGLTEIKTLQQIAKYEQLTHGHKANYLHIYDGFMWEGHLCIVMELLDNSLLNILENLGDKGVEIKWVEMWAKDILGCLAKIHAMGIMHCDIKPENIMFRPQQPQKPLLIDYSSSCKQSTQIFTYLQSRFYRSPEVLLAMKPYTPAIDIWSLGCVLAEMYLGLPIFPGGCGYDQIQMIYAFLGSRFDNGDGDMILASQYGHYYFNVEQIYQVPKNLEDNSNGNRQSMKQKQLAQLITKQQHKNKQQNSDQYEQQQQPLHYKITLKSQKQHTKSLSQHSPASSTPCPSVSLPLALTQPYYILQSFTDLLLYRNPSPKDMQTHQLFIDLLKKMLVFNPKKRITAQQAYLHPFIGGTFSELEQLRSIQQIVYNNKANATTNSNNTNTNTENR